MTEAQLTGMGDMDMHPDENSIQNFVEVLEKHRVDCEREGKYEEAELARQRLAQMLEREENHRREELKHQQLNERLGVEEAHMKELQEFNEIWDRKVADFEAHAADLQHTLAQRHKAEKEGYIEKLRRETQPITPRWSRDLLNLRKIQETQAKQKKYGEASQTKAQADKVEEKEHAVWQGKREQKIGSIEQTYVQKQSLEMNGLLKRIQSGREEQKQARKSELERLLQRYHNVKTQLESQQKIIQQRVERYPLGNAASSFTGPPSRPSTASKGSIRR